MLMLLSIVAGFVGIFTASWFFQKHVEREYCYSIFSIGGMGVSILGAIAFVFACVYYHQGLVPNMAVAIILGVLPYLCMFIRDTRKTSIAIAITALILRFTISAVFIAVVLWYFFKRDSSYDMRKAVR